MSKCRCSSNTSLLFQLNFQSTAPRTHVDLFVSSLISTGRNWDSPHLWNLLGLYRISTTVWHVAFSQPAIWDTDFKARDQCRLTDCLLQISEEWANNFPPQGLFFLTTMCKVKTSSASPKMSPPQQACKIQVLGMDPSSWQLTWNWSEVVQMLLLES